MTDTLRLADEAASVAHDYIWPQQHPVDAIGDEVPSVTREEASDAIWTIHNALRPLLAALPPSDPPALAQPAASIDVERLAQALFYSIGPGNLNGYPYDDEYRAIFRENADDTLAEYARLSRLRESAAQPLALLGGEAQPAEDK